MTKERKNWGGDRGTMTEEEWARECGAMDELTMRAMALMAWGSFILFAIVIVGIISLIKLLW